MTGQDTNTTPKANSYAAHRPEKRCKGFTDLPARTNAAMDMFDDIVDRYGVNGEGWAWLDACALTSFDPAWKFPANPMAVTQAVMTRVGACVPPTWRTRTNDTPAGSPYPVHSLTLVVSESGTGKGKAVERAAALAPLAAWTHKEDELPASGEALPGELSQDVQVDADTGKPDTDGKARHVRTVTGPNPYPVYYGRSSEATAFVQDLRRENSKVAQAFTKAFDGGDIGWRTKNDNRKAWGATYGIDLELQIQPAGFGGIKETESQGLAQRFNVVCARLPYTSSWAPRQPARPLYTRADIMRTFFPGCTPDRDGEREALAALHAKLNGEAIRRAAHEPGGAETGCVAYYNAITLPGEFLDRAAREAILIAAAGGGPKAHMFEKTATTAAIACILNTMTGTTPGRTPTPNGRKDENGRALYELPASATECEFAREWCQMLQLAREGVEEMAHAADMAARTDREADRQRAISDARRANDDADSEEREKALADMAARIRKAPGHRVSIKKIVGGNGKTQTNRARRQRRAEWRDEAIAAGVFMACTPPDGETGTWLTLPEYAGEEA